MPTIPLPEEAEPFLLIKTTLDGTSYVLKLEWNMRSGWYLGLIDAAGNVIFSPKKLVVDHDMLLGVTDERRPPGKLAVLDMSLLGREPGYESLGTTHFLAYISEEELAELTG